MSLRTEFGFSPRKARRRRPELTEEQQQEVREAFELFDTDKDSRIDAHELKVAMRALGFDVRKEEVLRILQDLGKDEGETIEFSEFHDIMKVKISERDPHEEIERAFRLFDEDGTGVITVANLKRIARELGEHLTDDEIRQMIDEFDRSGKNGVDMNDFIAIMMPEDL